MVLSLLSKQYGNTWLDLQGKHGKYDKMYENPFLPEKVNNC